MRRLTITFVLSTALSSGASAELYGWSLSLSSTDPGVHTGPSGGAFVPTDFYLWLNCSTSPQPGGVAAAEFDILFTGGLFPGAPTLVYPEMLNGGSGDTFQLAIGGCPTGPTLMISWSHLNTDGSGIDGCLAGLNQSADCDPVSPSVYTHAYRGANTQGSAPCESGTILCVSSPDESSWGAIKSLYR